MRLIDADEMKIKGYMRLSGYTVTNRLIGEVIDSVPTVQAVPIEEVLKIIEFEEKWLSQTRMSIRDIDIAFDAMKSKIKQIEGSDAE